MPESAEAPIGKVPIAEAAIAEALIALRRQITLSLRSKIRSLHTIALWPFRHIAKSVDLPLSTVFSICTWSGTPYEIRTGRPPSLSPEHKRLLLAHATLLAENRRKSLYTITEELDIHVYERILHRFFADSGYYHRIARVKPYLTPKQKIACLLFPNTYIDWAVGDWVKVIWTNECTFNMGGFSSNTWVTRTVSEEYFEDCILLTFCKLQTIMVWSGICSGIKGPMVIWDNDQWGKSVTRAKYCEHIITPYLYPFWCQLSLESFDYVYLQ
ncbi:hypothetical protein C7212DRAFT_274038 [Tuber magnatum]|uniref:Transposase Tc1-like domain-containing protein n=1 Tax=Tuber magnatum TaxID=42249 RepID=A0A317T270_9PEZI|nr:hypothetical protein C7212DRAFT_274038 [Tuber magnatum]